MTNITVKFGVFAGIFNFKKRDFGVFWSMLGVFWDFGLAALNGIIINCAESQFICMKFITPLSRGTAAVFHHFGTNGSNLFIWIEVLQTCILQLCFWRTTQNYISILWTVEDTIKANMFIKCYGRLYWKEDGGLSCFLWLYAMQLNLSIHIKVVNLD